MYKVLQGNTAELIACFQVLRKISTIKRIFVKADLNQ